MSPRERCASPIDEAVLVASPGPPAAAAPRTDETEDRMVVSERRYCRGLTSTRARLNGMGRNEPAATAANARQVPPPD